MRGTNTKTFIPDCDDNKLCVPFLQCEYALQLQQQIDTTSLVIVKTVFEEKLTDLTCGEISENLVCCDETGKKIINKTEDPSVLRCQTRLFELFLKTQSNAEQF